MTSFSESLARICRGAGRALLAFLLPLALAGCFQLEQTIQVRRDGSGVLIERIVLSHQVIEMASGMQPEGQEFKVRDDEKLRARASNYGASVRFLSARDIETDAGRGYEARYAFDDINRLRVGQDVDGNPSGGSEDKKYTTFSMTGGSPAELVVHWAKDQEAPESGAGEIEAADAEQQPRSPEEEQMAMEMMRGMLADMRMAVHVEVMGDIAETNATHVKGSRVTLVDIDFNAFLDNEEALKAMAADKPQSPADLKALMKLIPGLKVEVEPEVVIRFY